MRFKNLIFTLLIGGVSLVLICNNNLYVKASTKDINIQLEELYETIEKETGLDSKYIKQLHLMAGGHCTYADKHPDIYTDELIDDLELKIKGSNTSIKKANFIEYEGIERPSDRYLPDIVYTLANDIQKIIEDRKEHNRGGLQNYFNALNADVKQNILFYEALALYTGENIFDVNKIYQAYEKIMYDKRSNENIVEELPNGTLKIKDKFKDIFNNIGIDNNDTLDILAYALQFDRDIYVHSDIDAITTKYVLPYKVNYTSRENLMVAAMSLTGRVRYVWGGGHSGSSFIDGINPMWRIWNDLYPDEPTTNINGVDVENEGFGTCIKPSGTWCPTHGNVSSAFHGGAVYSLEEYLDTILEYKDEVEKYKDMLSNINYSNGLNIHTLNGLDCSGFTSWLYNQITDKYLFNSVALSFAKQRGMKEVEYGSELLPGDTFGWKSHIVAVIGKVKDGSKAYVTIEQTPNVLKFGVIYYSGASNSDIEQAKDIARQANQLIGGLNPEYEKPHVYCMDSVVEADTEIQYVTEYKTKTVWFPHYAEDPDYNPYDHVPAEEWDYTDQVFVDNGYLLTYYIPVNTEEIVTTGDAKVSIARFRDEFIDENTPVGVYNKPIKEMTAVEVINHTLTKLPLTYVDGFDLYGGDLFNKNFVASNLGIDIDNKKTNKEVIDEIK